MKNLLYLLIITLFVNYSCSKSNKAIEDYCNCMHSIISDSLLSMDIVNKQHTICFDSITNKYKLNDDAEFQESFDSLIAIKDLKININSRISENIDNILQTYMWEFIDVSSLNWRTYELRRYYFDGKIFKQDLYGMQYGSMDWHIEDSWTGIYKVDVENNGRIYIEISFDDNESDIYRFQKSKKDGYYLDGRRTLWQENK